MAIACTAILAPNTPVSAQFDHDQIFELSPFVVPLTRDRGYTAASSLAGGRLATDLRDTAASISVFTVEFLADIGVSNFLDAARWAPNAVPQEEIDSANPYNDYAVNFRGMGRGFQSRNYFRWYINSDTFSTERIDFARGPNSLVFGDAGVGGVANISSKQALGSGRTFIEGQWNSFGGYRTTLDSDIRLHENFDVRFALMYQDFDSWQNVGYDKNKGAFITTTFRPFERTTIRVEVEAGERRRLITFNTLDMLSNWDGVTTNPGFIGRRDPTPASLTRFNSPRLVFNPARPEWGVMDLEGFAATSGTFGVGLKTTPQDGMPDFAVIPGGSYKFSLQAPNGGLSNPYYTASAFLEQQIGSSLFVELAFNYQYQERDITRWFFDQLYVEVNETLPGGIVNPYLGEIYGWARYWDNLQSNEVSVVRATLAYLFENRFGEHRLLASAGHRADRFEDHNYELVRTNGRIADVRAADNRIFIHRYLSDGNTPVTEPPAIDPVSGIESRVAKTNAFFSEKPVTFAQAALSSRWFNDGRMVTLAGVRRDSYREKVSDRSRDERAPGSMEFLRMGDAIKTDDQNVVSYTASAVYHIDQRFSLSASYSESFDPGSTARSITGASLEPLINNGIEFGVRAELFDGRLVASLAYYISEQENNRVGGQATAINGIWGLIGMPQNEVPAPYSDRQTNEGKGWEFELTAMPTDNWRILFNLSFPQTSITDGFADTRNYVSDNLALWQAEANRLEAEGAIGSANAVRSRIDTINAAVESVTRGRKLDGTFQYTANLFTRYFFTEGKLEGFSVGGGVNMRGKRLIGNRLGDPFDYLYADGYTLASLLLGYDRELKRGELSLQLNVSNLLDREIVRPGSAAGSGFGFTVQDPRNILVTVRYRF